MSAQLAVVKRLCCCILQTVTNVNAFHLCRRPKRTRLRGDMMIVMAGVGIATAKMQQTRAAVLIKRLS